MSYIICIVLILALFSAGGSAAVLGDPFRASLAVDAASECDALNASCTLCMSNTACAFCPGAEAKCVPVMDAAMMCNSTGYCGGGTADHGACRYVCTPPCSEEMYPCSENTVGQIILMFFWGAVLAGGAKLISDGSELLLELFPAYGTVIGALVLPVLGAVPDAAIILVSGLGGTLAEANESLKVGVGTLVGSSVMLLTFAWAASVWVGRCDLNEFGEAIDGECGKVSLTRQGVSVDEDTPINFKLMLLFSVNFLVVQGVGFYYQAKGEPTSARAVHVERGFALAGMILCLITLLAYCVYQIAVPKLAKRRTEGRRQLLAEKHARLRALHVMAKFPAFANVLASDNTATNVDSAELREARALDVAQQWKAKALLDKRRQDAIKSSSINDERVQLLEHGDDDDAASSASSDDEDVAAHFWYYLAKACVLMVAGVAVVAIFSDPMVEVIGKFGTNVGIPAFYVSFVVTPFCSNASELISSLVFAAKKRVANASLTFSQLAGAATLNATLNLGIFYALVYFRGLAWAFSAEIVSILVVTVVIGIIGFKRHFPLWWIIPVGLMYVVALGIVALLESPAINWL